MSTVYLAVIAAYDLNDSPPDITLYYSTGLGFVSGAADTPAHTYFSPRLSQPLNVRRQMFAEGTTRGKSTVSLGEIRLNNMDGALDYLRDVAFDGRAITVYRGEHDAAFPSGFVQVWSIVPEDDVNKGIT